MRIWPAVTNKLLKVEIEPEVDEDHGEADKTIIVEAFSDSGTPTESITTSDSGESERDDDESEYGSDYDIELSPKVLVSDFELASINVFKFHFPSLRIQGCHFHLLQAIRLKCQYGSKTYSGLRSAIELFH
jgi:hypothetical protein